jgi:hypothetical protein
MIDIRGTEVVPGMNALRNHSDIAGMEVYTFSPNPQVEAKRAIFFLQFAELAQKQLFCTSRLFTHSSHLRSLLSP